MAGGCLPVVAGNPCRGGGVAEGWGGGVVDGRGRNVNRRRRTGGGRLRAVDRGGRGVIKGEGRDINGRRRARVIIGAEVRSIHKAWARHSQRTMSGSRFDGW